MPKGYVRKKCRDCRRTTQGRAAKLEWCDCGDELIAIPYGNRRKARRGR